MQKFADYIKRIEIDSLWSGKKHIVWELDPHVNILSGINGQGKSTIINKVVKGLSQGGEFPSHMLKGVRLDVVPEDAKWIRYDMIRSLDSSLSQVFADEEGVLRQVLPVIKGGGGSLLDFQLYQLQRKYLDYQVNIGNRIIAELQAGRTEAAQQLSEKKTRFQDIVDDLFAETGKRIVMDEPEVSLHIEWQKRLIDLCRELNPNVQIILTTHSPAVVMNGWVDSVTEVSDITS